MFVRKLKHPNGKVYVQVVEKQSGKYRLLKSFGGTADKKSLALLVSKARRWIEGKRG